MSSCRAGRAGASRTVSSTASSLHNVFMASTISVNEGKSQGHRGQSRRHGRAVFRESDAIGSQTGEKKKKPPGEPNRFSFFIQCLSSHFFNNKESRKGREGYRKRARREKRGKTWTADMIKLHEAIGWTCSQRKSAARSNRLPKAPIRRAR